MRNILYLLGIVRSLGVKDTAASVESWVWRGGRLRGAASPFFEEGGQDQEVVGQHGRADEGLESIAPVEETALHAASAEQDGDATLAAGTETLPLLEGPAVLVRFALGGLLASALGDALEAARLLAGGDVVLAVEAAIRRQPIAVRRRSGSGGAQGWA